MTSDRERAAYASLRFCRAILSNYIELRCSFEMSDDETFSQSSQSSLSIEDENMPENVIRPYQFEPEFSSSEESVEEEGYLEGEQQHEDENFRTRNLDW